MWYDDTAVSHSSTSKICTVVRTNAKMPTSFIQGVLSRCLQKCGRKACRLIDVGHHTVVEVVVLTLATNCDGAACERSFAERSVLLNAPIDPLVQ